MAQQRESANDRWGASDPYERYVGRWSRLVATEFVRWLSVESGAAWADVGCGTGALTQTVLRDCNPRSIHGVDKSAGFVAAAAASIADPRARFEIADAMALPMADACCDAAVSGLVLNFVGRPAAMVAEMTRVTRQGGQVAAYVWDYGDGMQMMRRFWDAAIATCGESNVPDEARHFPLCAPEPLLALWRESGLTDVEVRAIEIPTHFSDFDDYWQPFLGRQGVAPTWLAGLAQEKQDTIREMLQSGLPYRADGGIHLAATTWAVKGRRNAPRG